MSHVPIDQTRWFTLSLMEQLGNIGSEVGRAKNWMEKDPTRFQGARDRALELFDITLLDPRWNAARQKEIALIREFFLSATEENSTVHVTLTELETELTRYALAARRNHEQIRASAS
jgi:hypothetical protein